MRTARCGVLSSTRLDAPIVLPVAAETCSAEHGPVLQVAKDEFSQYFEDKAYQTVAEQML
jgi:hypothetical protein